MLTSRSQKELAVNADAAVSAVRHDVTNTHTTVPGVQNDVVNTLAITSNSHRTALKNPEDTRSKNRMVSTIRTIPAVE